MTTSPTETPVSARTSAAPVSRLERESIDLRRRRLAAARRRATALLIAVTALFIGVTAAQLHGTFAGYVQAGRGHPDEQGRHGYEQRGGPAARDG